MSHSNKWLVSLLGLLAFSALVLTACGGATESPAKAIEPVLAANSMMVANPAADNVGMAVGSAQAACTPGREVDKPAFFTEVIQALQDPAASANDFTVKAFLAWEPYENTNACWNPLATTWRMPGGTDFNSAGVQNYPDRATGIRATANTLNETYNFYQPIRTMLAKQGFDEAALTQALIKWVGSPAYADAVVAQWKAMYNQ